MSARGDILNTGYSDLQGDVQQFLLKHHELPLVIFLSPRIACRVSVPLQILLPPGFVWFAWLVQLLHRINSSTHICPPCRPQGSIGGATVLAQTCVLVHIDFILLKKRQNSVKHVEEQLSTDDPLYLLSPPQSTPSISEIHVQADCILKYIFWYEHLNLFPYLYLDILFVSSCINKKLKLYSRVYSVQGTEIVHFFFHLGNCLLCKFSILRPDVIGDVDFRELSAMQSIGLQALQRTADLSISCKLNLAKLKGTFNKERADDSRDWGTCVKKRTTIIRTGLRTCPIDSLKPALCHPQK